MKMILYAVLIGWRRPTDRTFPRESAHVTDIYSLLLLLTFRIRKGYMRYKTVCMVTNLNDPRQVQKDPSSPKVTRPT